MAVSLTTLLPPTRSGRTLFFSSSVLGTFAFLQMVMLCWHLLQSSSRSSAANNAAAPTFEGSRSQPAPGAPAIHFAETIEPSTSSLEVPYRRNSAVANATNAALAAAAPKATDSAPLPTPADQAFERPTPAEVAPASVAGMIEHARRLRLSGDATTALAELRQAQIADPSSPQVIAELGITYEAMQLSDRAFEQWQRLYNMGTGIGALYYLADEKLHNAPPAAPALGTALPGLMPDQAPVDAAGSGRDNAGFQDNAMLKITDIHVDDANDPAAGRKVSLKIVVKNRPGTVIDPHKVHVETYFYDLLDGKDVVQTNEQTETTHQWLTTPVNWANDQSEVLETTYFRSKDADAAAPTPTPVAEDAARGFKRGRHGKGHGADTTSDASPAPSPPQVRAYLGYSVRLYYDRQLQDVQADPLRLLQQFPPQLTLTDQ
jgi:hypothetical protein